MLGRKAFTVRAEVGFNALFGSGLTLSLGAGFGLAYEAGMLGSSGGSLSSSLGYAF